MKAFSRGWLLLALVLAAVNLRPALTSLAPLVEQIAGDLGLSRALVSLSTALPVLCMGLLAPLAPGLAQRFGLERVIYLCMWLLVVALAARAWPGSAGLLIGSAVVLGAAIAVAGPLLSGFIKRHFAEQVGTTVTWYSVAMTVGGGAGAVLTLPAMHVLSERWELGLAVWALPALIAAVLWALVPKTPVAGRTDGAAGLPWRNHRAWLLSVFFTLQAGMFYAIATWIVARYHEAGLSALRSNSLLSIVMLMGLPGAFVLPWVSQRFNARYLPLLACALITCMCLSMITFAPTWLPELWAVVMGFTLSGSFALSLVLPLYEANSPLDVSRFTAMMLFTGYSVGSVTPVLVGLIRDLSGGYQWPFLILTAMALAKVCVVTLLARKSRSYQ